MSAERFVDAQHHIWRLDAVPWMSATERSLVFAGTARRIYRLQ